jgi:uncharacterized OB-fold protein
VTESSARGPGNPARSETGTARPGGEAAQSGKTESSARRPGNPARSETGPERPGGEAAQSGKTESSAAESGETASKYFPDGMPLPQPEPATAGFWDGCAARELRIQRCTSCGTHRHVPTPLCSNCRSFEHTWDVSTGNGTIFSYIVVHHSVHDATNAAVPYNVAVIQLDDCGGVLVTSNVVGCANDDLYVTMPVRVIWEQVDPSLSLYRFTPRRDDVSS